MGLKGNMNVNWKYMINEDGKMIVRMEDVKERKKIWNMIKKRYLNMDEGGEGDVIEKKLKIEGEEYIKVDEEIIKERRVMKVKEKDLDLRELRKISMKEKGSKVEYENNLWIEDERGKMRKWD